MDKIERLLCEWGYWLQNTKVESDRGSPKMASSRINQMMAGQIEKGFIAPVFRSVELAGFALNQEADERYLIVDKAIARLPKRRREAVMIEYLFCVNGNQEDKASYMRPAVKRNTYAELLKFAKIQLINAPDVKALLK